MASLVPVDIEKLSDMVDELKVLMEDLDQFMNKTLSKEKVKLSKVAMQQYNSTMTKARNIPERLEDFVSEGRSNKSKPATADTPEVSDTPKATSQPPVGPKRAPKPLPTEPEGFYDDTAGPASPAPEAVYDDTGVPGQALYDDTGPALKPKPSLVAKKSLPEDQLYDDTPATTQPKENPVYDDTAGPQDPQQTYDDVPALADATYDDTPATSAGSNVTGSSNAPSSGDGEEPNEIYEQVDTFGGGTTNRHQSTNSARHVGKSATPTVNTAVCNSTTSEDGKTDIADIAAGDIVNPDAYGYLEKKAPATAGWGIMKGKLQKRWFVLKQTILYYYEDKDGKKGAKQKKAFYLNGYELKCDDEGDKKKKKKNSYVMQLSRAGDPAGRVYELKAKNSEDFHMWVVAFTRAIKETAQNGSAGPQPPVFSPDADDSQDIYEAVNDGEVPQPAPAVSPSVKPPPPPEEIYDDAGIDEDDELYDDVATPPDNHATRPKSKRLSINRASRKSITWQSDFKAELNKGTVKPDNLFVAVWDNSASESNELSFKQGDMMHVIDKETYGGYEWWIAEINGKIGIVPKSYISPAFEAVAM